MSTAEASFDGQLKKWGLLILIGVFSIYLGVSLASDLFLVLGMIMAVAWFVTIPRHSFLSICIAVATFRSAFIVPFFPGRPYVWELAALLGWTGTVALISMKQYGADQITQLRRNKLMLVGMVGYCAVLVVLMLARGVGLNVLGSDQIGGRYYFQQLACSIFPILFIFVPLKEQTLVRLVYLQFLLALSHMVPDLVFSLGARPFQYLLYFFEVPGDASNFVANSLTSGFQRFQSLGWASVGVMLFLLTRSRVEDFFTLRKWHFVVIWLVAFGVGMLSGQRIIALVILMTIVFCAYAQRALNVRNCGVGLGVLSLTLVVLYLAAPHLSMAAQRSISFLPGIEIHEMAREDAKGTLVTRKVLRELGWQQVPNYFWLGRGFGQDSRSDLSERWDPTSITLHISQGRYYNGVIGLLVNTGFPGFLFMSLFLAGIFKVVYKSTVLLRRHGCYDRLSLVVCVVNGLFVTNAITFTFFHGDSEYAMKTFSLQAGLIIACYYHLDQRYNKNVQTPVQAGEEVENKALA